MAHSKAEMSYFTTYSDYIMSRLTLQLFGRHVVRRRLHVPQFLRSHIPRTTSYGLCGSSGARGLTPPSDSICADAWYYVLFDPMRNVNTGIIGEIPMESLMYKGDNWLV